jgi:hypothetical protein
VGLTFCIKVPEFPSCSASQKLGSLEREYYLMTTTNINKRHWQRFLPITIWLPRYQRAWLPTDLVAGLAIWALTVPQALAYAGIAGVPPQYGLYAIPLAMLAHAIFGTSRLLSVGPDSALFMTRPRPFSPAKSNS